ncbi:DUF86 domain-containing protein [Rhodoferax sp. AJA081-3]|uniref:HepT-like ribonuclease domain-containing protein n=1 Tax=Rhodoferax sp. AJA081-3 TaxID=2752316 RepID=UPI001ADED387|nr:DUF86 domain-containing protein [Rhodoferax sp. AJA081-3]QTN28931.1 DUF86 domain-containing protein [Rhodoferax sp. AJA081-3]
MSEREWRFYITDMVGFCEKVLAFTQGLQQAQFVADAMRFDATVRNLELVGEAASHIPQDVRNAHPTIPWRMLIATRNQLIHGYLGLDNDILWSIVQTDVPVLLQQLKLLASEEI